MHRRHGDVSIGIEAAFARDIAQEAVIDGVDRIDRNAKALHERSSCDQRRRRIEAALGGDILAQHNFVHRTVGQIGDRHHPLPGDRRADQRAGRAAREIDAAGDHGVDRADAGDLAHGDIEPLLFQKPLSCAT